MSWQAASPRISSHEAILELLREETLGEYEILGELGRGGMATVYLAHDISLDRKVAIKVMSPALMDEGLSERFRREARTAAALNHPHVIPIYAVRERAPLLFFVMKFIPGQSLDPILKTLGQMPIPMAHVILGQAAGALGYAHRRGVIHRDVKPANIMLDEEGWVVMTDFGIAKVSSATGLTMTGVTVGTPAYMSPEQCLGKEVTGASDQYSLGVVAYEMLTGRKPFIASTAMAMMYAHFNEEPKPIRELRSDVPPELEAGVMRMLSKDPDQRWPRIDDVFGAPSLAHDDPTRQQLVSLALTSTNATMAARISTPTSPVPPARRSTMGRTGTGAPTEPMAPAPAPADSGRARTGGGAGATVPAEPARPLQRETAPSSARRTASAAPKATDHVAQPAKRSTWIPWAGAAALGGLVMALLVARTTGKPAVGPTQPADTAATISGSVPVDTARPGGGGAPVDTVRTRPDTVSGGTVPEVPPVVQLTVGRIQVQPARLQLEAGQSATLALQLWTADGRPIREQRESRWSSSAPNVVGVASDGTISGLRLGRATVTATVDGKRATATIEVRAAVAPPPTSAAVASVSVTPPNLTLTVGRTQSLRLVLLDARGNQLADRTVSWTSSSPAVTVSPRGEVQAVAPGTAVVTATVEGRSASSTITVPQAPVASVRLSAPPGPLKPGESVQLTATAVDAGGGGLEGRTVTWSSSNPDVATVSEGRVVARSAGTAEIAATIEGRREAVTVTVTAAAPIVDAAAERARAVQETNRLLDAFVDALNRRDMNQLRRVYPDMPANQETAWQQLLGAKNIKLEARRDRAEDLRLEGKTAETRFTLRLRLQAGGDLPNNSETKYRAVFEQDSSRWQLRQLVPVSQ
jgi:serine/threonine-protein kinase